ncbi:hypothetical protein J7M28_14140 [bacterium]|nr:hypothetical protein [bacterium]
MIRELSTKRPRAREEGPRRKRRDFDTAAANVSLQMTLAPRFFEDGADAAGEAIGLADCF